jgi:hypothetical protein
MDVLGPQNHNLKKNNEKLTCENWLPTTLQLDRVNPEHAYLLVGGITNWTAFLRGSPQRQQEQWLNSFI